MFGLKMSIDHLLLPLVFDISQQALILLLIINNTVRLPTFVPNRRVVLLLQTDPLLPDSVAPRQLALDGFLFVFKIERILSGELLTFA